MPVSKNRQFAKIANDVATDGTLTAEAISSDVTLGGATIYATRSALPVSGNTAGDQAYVTGNNRLYIWNGSGWYNVALLNLAPSITSVQDSDGNTTPFTLATDGTATTITITATDSDGDPVTFSSTADSDFAGLATLSQDSSVFTITPFSQDSATTTSGTITFTASDGINLGTSGVQTFTLNFISALWDETVLSVGTSSTNSLDNSTFIDRSTNGHTVTSAGTPFQTAFHPYLDYWSAEFDGSGDYLQIADNDDFHIGASDFTIEGWLYKEDTGTWSSLIGQRVGSTAEWRIILDISGTGTYTPGNFRIDWGGSYFYFDGANIPNDAWTHFALVRSGTTGTLYINGTSVDTNTLNDVGNYSAPLRIGTNDGSGEYYKGSISNLRIVKGTALYTSNFTPPTEKLTAVSGTTLLTCQSNRFIDNSASAHSITVNGNTKISAFNPFGQGSEYAVGENKGSTYFDGSGDYLRCDAALDFHTNANDPFTMEAWVYPFRDPSTAGSTINDMIFGVNSGSSGSNTAMLATGIYHLGGDTNLTKKAGKNQWSHMAMSYDGTNIRYFTNGEEVGSETWGGNVLSDDVLGIAAEFDAANGGSPGNYFQGYISDVVVSTTGKYTTDFTPSTVPVGNTNASLYLPMDNPGIYDKTGNNILTLVGDVSTSTTQTKFADTAMYFDGNVDRIQKLGGIEVNMSSFTIEGWIYPTSWSSGTATSMFAFNRSSDGSNVLLYSANGLYYGSGASDYWTGTGLSTNQWSHVAVTYDGTTVKAYENGTEVLSQSHTFTTNFSDCDFVLGSEFDDANGGSPGNYLTGYIENFQIISGVVKYTSNFTVPSQEQGRRYQAES